MSLTSGMNMAVNHSISHTYKNGTIRMWFCYGKCHRIDGPAVEYKNGEVEWWINDKKKKFSSFIHYIKNSRDVPSEIKLMCKLADYKWIDSYNKNHNIQ